jgi:sigma-70-like protein
MADPWPTDLCPAQVAWPERLGRVLRDGGLLVGDRLERLTYGQLLAMTSVGPKCVLELGVIADALATPPGPLDEAANDALGAAAQAPWAGRVRSSDPRFGDVVPKHPGTVAEMLADACRCPEGRPAHALVRALPAIGDRVAQIGAEPLEPALARLCRGFGISERDLAVTVARLERSNGRHRTLQEVGDQFALTKERVRQIVDRATARLGGAYLPQLERAGRLLAGQVPTTVSDGARLLVERGLSQERVDVAQLVALADLLGYQAGVQVDRSGRVPLVLAAGQPGSQTVLACARHLAHRYGLSNDRRVAAALAADGYRLDPEAVALIRWSSPEDRSLPEGWFWTPAPRPDHRIVATVARRMLAVSAPLDPETIRQGLVRHCRDQGMPSAEVLAAFFCAHPEFVVDGRAVEPVAPLDAEEVLSVAELAFVEALRAAPGGRLSRAALERAVLAQGVDPQQFGSLMITSPVLDHPERGRWSLCGRPCSASRSGSVEAVKTGAGVQTSSGS